MAHGHGFAAPDQLRPATAEVAASADASGPRPAIGLAVPAFHRQEWKSDCRSMPVRPRKRPSKRRIGRRRERIVQRQIDSERCDIRFERIGRFQSSDSWKCHAHAQLEGWNWRSQWLLKRGTGTRGHTITLGRDDRDREAVPFFNRTCQFAGRTAAARHNRRPAARGFWDESRQFESIHGRCKNVAAECL